MRSVLAVSALLVACLAAAQSSPTRDVGAVDTRGDRVMGFSHQKTVHHFTLTADGGVISASADTSDAQSINAIRGHFQQISESFAAGDFRSPMLIHAVVPPGVPTMKRLRKDISYTFTPQKDGAAILIQSGNPAAVAAIHKFLVFQIKDHRTGDSTVPIS